VKRVGKAVKAARNGKSAAWLSDRTAELGYRISPTVIAKLDSGHRGDVLSVPELLILAAALDIPPALLLFPEFPDGEVELLPRFRVWVPKAVEWLAGNGPLPVQIHADGTIGEVGNYNRGTELVAAFARLKHVEGGLLELRRMEFREAQPEVAERLRSEIREAEQQAAAIVAEIARTKAALWGTPAEEVI